MAAISDNTLRAALADRLGAIHTEVVDMSGGCGQAFSTLIVSPQFRGLTSLKRHRLVNSALKEEIASIHAWTAKCQTPEEWERNRAETAPSLAGTVHGHVEGTKE